MSLTLVQSASGDESTGLTVSILRELFRNLVSWRSLYQSDGIDQLTGPDGEDYSLWDIEWLFEQIHLLPPRQRQAIELCLILNVRERDAAVQMGVSPSNPVAMYATLGLEKLVAMVEDGSLERSKRDREVS